MHGTRDPAHLPGEGHVEVWVGDACAESLPPQCEIEVVRVVTTREG